MASTRMAKLITRLLAKTESGDIKWEETAESDVYQTSFPGYSVQVSVEPGQGGQDFFLTIFNEDGNTVESVSDVDMKDVLDNAYPIMRDLYEAARRSAMGVDVAIDKILSALDDDIPF